MAEYENQLLLPTKPVQVNILNDVDYILLLPHNDSQLNSRILSRFTAKLGQRKGVVIEGAQADEILALYSLYAFTDKLIVGSFDLPYGRKLRNLLDSGVATQEELIDDVILGAM